MAGKKVLYCCSLLLIACFLFSRAHFFFAPLPEIKADSILYMTVFESAYRDGKLPDHNYVPLGYPLICYIFSHLFGSVISIAFFQHFLTLFAGLYLLYSVYLTFNALILPVTIGLCVFVLSGYNVWYDSSIVTESVYSSIILILAATMAQLVYTGKPRFSVMVSFLLFCLLMVRPTGIFGLVVCILIACYFVWQKNRGVATMLVGTYFILVFLLSFYNYLVSQEFAPISISRTKSEMKRHNSYDKAPQLLVASDADEKPSLCKAYKHYYWIEETRVFEQMYLMPRLKFFYWDWPRHLFFGSPDSLKTIKKPVSILNSDWYKKKAFLEYYNYDFVHPLEAKDTRFRNSTLFKLYDLYQLRIASFVFRNMLWVYFLWAAFASSLFFIFFVRPVSKEFLWLSGICLLNIGNSSMHIISNHRTLLRYEYPGEAVIYVIGLVFITIILRGLIKKLKVISPEEKPLQSTYV